MTGLLAAPGDSTDEEQNQGAEGCNPDRPQVEVAAVDRSPAESRPDESAEYRPHDPEEDGEDAAGGIAPRHDELRQRTGDQTEEKPEKPRRHVRRIGMSSAQCQGPAIED